MSNGISKTDLNLIPAGYKQTEVGVIPEDWECSNLDYICSTIGDGIHSTPTYNNNGEYFFINGNNLIDGKITTFNETKKTDFVEFYKHKKNLNERTILLSINGTIGNIAFYRDEQIVLGKSVAYLNIKSTIDKYYIYYCLCSEKTLQTFYDGLTGSTIKNLGLGTIRTTNIPLPPKKEQTAIANALSDVDALISELKNLISKKQAIKTATMQQLLTGRTRLPQFALREDGSKKGTKQSELGEIPEDWEVKSFHQLATVKSGGTPSTHNKDFWDGKINWCTPTDITALVGRKYLSTTTRKITEIGVAKSAAELLPIGTVVMTSRATIGECAITTSEITTNQGFKNFICGSELDNEFLYYLLSNVKERLICLCSGSTFLEISTTQVKNFSVITTEKKEQTAIATILSDMDEEIQVLEQRLNKTRKIKQGMMQELLTGKTRLVQPSPTDICHVD
ncbi:restriction endonuclease subunit S [Proteus mirabilis]|uniref:restriction endonuclease subunit S n=1 Tax=Proteus mirabilis TaxID=584 RepID=UPI0034D4D104